MKLFGCLLIILLFAGFTRSGAQGFCPVNFNGEVLHQLQADPSLYYGRMLACNGEIVRMEQGTKGLPYFLLRLDKGGEIWVSAQAEGGFEGIGSRVRVLGFFEKAAAGYKPPNVHKDPYHLVAIAQMHPETGDMIMQSGQEKIVQQWLDGKIPDPGKRKWQH